MRVSVSNIAWDITEDDDVYQLLKRFGVDAIDIAPTKYFANLTQVSDHDVLKVKSWWGERGVEIVGMQSLLFGTKNLNVFASSDIQSEMLKHLTVVCRIASLLGVNSLVFGSPRNRDKSIIREDEVLDVAISFFRKLGDVAESHNVIVCLEPNPKDYGANFMTNSDETASIVNAVDHSAIKMQLDTGAMAMNGEDFNLIIPKYASLYGHIHLSEPKLVTLGDGGVKHDEIAPIIKRHMGSAVASIEMLSPKNESNVNAVQRALMVAMTSYGNN